MVDQASLIDLYIACRRLPLVTIGMCAVSKADKEWVHTLKGWHLLQHLEYRRLVELVIVYQWSWRMASEVMKQMKGDLEVFLARLTHETTELANSKDFFITRVCEPVQGSRYFNVSKAVLVLKSQNFLLVRCTVVHRQITIEG